ncbi:MAG: hypothetical protein WA996_06565 [Candidatus Promineifilaceae bacterium]
MVALGNIVLLFGRTSGSHTPPEVETQATVIRSARVEKRLVTVWFIGITDANKARAPG